MKNEKTNVEIAAEAINALKRALPPFMPADLKVRLIDLIYMNGKVMALDRQSETVLPSDIYAGLYKIMPNSLTRHLALRVPDLRRNGGEYRQAAERHDFVSLESQLLDFSRMAKLRGRALSAERLKKGMEAFREVFEGAAVYIKTTDREQDPPELFFRAGHATRLFDFEQMSRRSRGEDFSRLPGYAAWRSLYAAARPAGSMIDLDADGGVQKLYAFNSLRLLPVERLSRCATLPESLRSHLGWLRSIGLSHAIISGVDLKLGTVNLYFHLDPREGAQPRLVSALFERTGFEPPTPGLMSWISRSGIVYLTFAPGKPGIERLCFSAVLDGPASRHAELASLAPNLKPYITEAPLRTKRRNLIAGFTFGPGGFYLKAEWDYKAGLFLQGYSAWSGMASRLSISQ
jgi:hypothetical protein